jgi:hypothetical protein
MKYLKSERRNGVRTASEDEEVDQEYFDRFTSLETRRWFENLGGTEEMRRNRSGVIYLKSTSPDGDEVREVVFTPIPEVTQ